jgi:hypothetical protein
MFIGHLFRPNGKQIENQTYLFKKSVSLGGQNSHSEEIRCQIPTR